MCRLERRGYGGVDHELLFVSAILHDIGITPSYDNVTLSYEHAGGHVAAALTAGAGWPQDRRQRVLEIIVRHNWPSVDPEFDIEGYLLEVATGVDISGARADVLPQDFVREVLTAHPRLDIGDQFTRIVTNQAERKPTTAAHRLVHGGLAQKMAVHPMDSDY